MKYSTLYTIKDLHEAYKHKRNVMQMLKEGNSDDFNREHKPEFIEIAYDLQSGSYIEAMEDPIHADLKTKKCSEYAQVVEKYIPTPKALLKAGVGEAVTLVPFLKSFKSTIPIVHGFDISLSRVLHARNYLDENGFKDSKLCTGTLQQIPFLDNSFDLIMTSHALEPNGGYEEIILEELKRVSSNIVALFEPSFENASDEGKVRMIEHGYIKNLPTIAEKLGFKVLYNSPLNTTMNSNNPTFGLILQVPQPTSSSGDVHYACPISKSKLHRFENGYFSEESFRYYPSIKNIPALRRENGVLASALINDLNS